MPTHPVHAALSSDYVKTLIRLKARQLRRRSEFCRTPVKDIEQELVLHVLQQAHLYDAARGAVNTFVATVVKSAAAMMCRDRRRLKRAAGLNLRSLEGSTLLDEGEEKTLADVIIDDDLRRRHAGYMASDEDRACASADTSVALSGLSSSLRAVARLLMEGAKEASVATRLGISRRQARKAIEKIREHFLRAGLE